MGGQWKLTARDVTTSAKTELRKILRDRRKSLSAPLRAIKSARIVDSLREHPAYRSAQSPAFTYPVGSEVDTLPLIRERLSLGQTVLLPRVSGEGQMTFHRIDPSLENLTTSDRGIPEPSDNPHTRVAPEDIDLFLVPGIGFDPIGNRLGQGGGYFDRYLSDLSERPNPAWRLAVAFDRQILPTLPTEPFDIGVDEILTERTTYRFARFEQVVESVEETHRFAQIVAGRVKPPGLIRLTGELGAGKTEWVRGFAHALGWRGRVRSPSFSLENIYEVEGATLYHMDGYRLTHPSHLDRDWFQEILEDPKGMVLLEWPERFGECVPFSSPELHIARLDGNSRTLSWVAYESRHTITSTDFE